MSENKTIINYCTSGLGNRLRSLASCYVISKETGRKLKIYWDNITPNGCLAKFSELFENEIETISLQELENLSDSAIIADIYDAQRELDKFGRRALINLVNKYSHKGKDGFNYDIQNDNIIVFNNNFLNTVNKEEAYKFLQSLEPIDEIQQRINSETERLILSKDIIGIHARGSDFGVGVEYYLNQIDNIIKEKSETTFFLITDDKEFEEIIINRILKTTGKAPLITNKGTFTEKINPNDVWQNHNNFELSKQHVQDAVMEMFLLAKTNIQVYHPTSTFCEIAKIISNK